MADLDDIVNYLFEAGMLKRVKRSGWWTCKIKDPETVAEHSFRAAVVALVLARLEGKGDECAHRICSAAVFHDMHETRILDLHTLAVKYLAARQGADGNGHGAVGKKVEEDQISALPEEVQQSLRAVMLGLREDERMILKDADLLEMALQAKEYFEIGYTDCLEWLANIEKRLKTKSAKQLMQHILATKSSEWYRGLKRQG